MPGEAGHHGGRSYGWPCREGFSTLSASCGPDDSLTYPFVVYGHGQAVPPTNEAWCSITGGMVYRGCAIPGLEGTYFFADYDESGETDSNDISAFLGSWPAAPGGGC